VRAIAPLDSQAAGMDPNAALRVISAYAFGGMAWSPGSGYLAYVSGKEGGSGEVYLYNVRSGQTTRLPAPTGDSPSYAFGLRFSPGGQKIYFNRAYEFGTSTYALAGAWVGGLDGSLVQVAGSQSSAEQLVAWMNEDQIMVSSVQPDCGEQNLRLVSLRGQPDQVVWPGCFADRIYERGLGSMILSVTPDIAAIQPSTPAGVYRVRIRDGSVQRITERSFTRLSSSGRAYTWYGYQPQEGLSLVSLNGQVTPVFQGPPYDGSDPELNRPLRAVSGQNAWFWDGNGLFLVDPSQPDQQPRVIFPLPVTNLTQSPSDRRLYFFLAYDGSAGRLYAIRAGEWQPYLVDEHIQTARSITWTH
jgi:hypothetical protein